MGLLLEGVYNIHQVDDCGYFVNSIPSTYREVMAFEMMTL